MLKSDQSPLLRGSILFWKILGTIIVSLGMSASLGILLGIPSLHQFGEYVRLSVWAGGGMVLLGVWLVVWVWRRRWLWVIVGVFMTCTTLNLWRAAGLHQLQAQKKELKKSVNTLRSRFSQALEQRIFALERMAKRWELNGGTPKALWYADAKRYVLDQKGYQAIEWLDKNMVVRWLYPLKGNEQAKGFDLSTEKERRTFLLRAKNTRQAQISKFVDLVQGGKGFLVAVPLFFPKRFGGYILGVFRVKELNDVILFPYTKTYHVRVLSSEGKSVYKSGIWDGQLKKVSSAFSLHGATWVFEISAKEIKLGMLSPIPLLVLCLGLLFSLLLTLLFFFYYKNTVYIYQLEKSKRGVEAANDELTKLNERLDEFAYTVAHDLKEPLRGIKNYSNMLLRRYKDSVEGKGELWLGSIEELTERMDKLINTLLYYASLGDDESSYVKKCKLDDILSRVTGDLSTFIEEKNLEIRIQKPMPEVYYNEVRLEEIFTNLISNAAKYNDKSEKWVEIGFLKLKEKSYPDAENVIYVKDNGIGIQDKNLDAIFKIFRRLHHRNDFGGGTGAGLTIVKKIVESHDGRIWVDSVYGEGTTFYFSVPRTEEQSQIISA